MLKITLLLAWCYYGDQRPVIQNRLGAFPIINPRYGGRTNNQKCPHVAPRSPYECAGQSSTCWSPGVRDTDCPSNGLCCFNGCVNICGPPPPTPR